MKERRDKRGGGAEAVRRGFARCLIAAAALIALSAAAVFGYLLGAFDRAAALGAGACLLAAGTLVLTAGFFRFTAWLRRTPPGDGGQEEG